MKTHFSLILAVLLFVTTAAGAVTPLQIERIGQIKKEAAALFEEKRFEEAIAILNEAIAIDPRDRTVRHYLALAKQQALEPFCREAAEAYQRESYATAIEIWDKLAKMAPEDSRIPVLIENTRNLVTDKATDDMFDHAEQFRKNGDDRAALSELEKILAIRPYDIRARGMYNTIKNTVVDVGTKNYYDQAELFMKEKRYDLAIGEWKKVLDIDPSQEAASRYIASAVKEKMDGLYVEAKQTYERGDYLAARVLYNRILSENPMDMDIKTIIDRLEDVLKVTLKVDEPTPAGEMMRKALANYIAVDGNRKTSLAGAWYAFQLSPTPLTIAVKGFLELKYVSLLSTMEAPVGDMNVIDQYLFSALNHIYEGRYDLAIQKCTIVLELQPANILGWKRLGSAYYALGKKDRARESWERALKHAPDDAELKQFIKQIK